MRRFQYFICMLIISVLFSGCTSTKDTKTKLNKNNSVDSVIQNEIDKTTATASVTDSAIVTSNITDSKKEKTKKGEKTDIDLTSMNSDMIYATVYDLTTKPDNYTGKKVKVKGTYTSSFYEKTSKYYHFVLIQDAAACCSQGLEFVLPDGMDYPKENKDITVVGTFETYMEEDTVYCHLVDAVIE